MFDLRYFAGECALRPIPLDAAAYIAVGLIPGSEISRGANSGRINNQRSWIHYSGQNGAGIS